ncbi:YhcG family protein, partial [Elusimicrobiota bacterium]
MTSSRRRVPGELARLPVGYVEFLDDVKTRIRASQIKAALSANRELILLYWDLGKSIVERQSMAGWGRSVVDRLATDLQRAFPGVEGFSPRNVWRMRAFYLAWTKEVRARAIRQSAPAILTRLVSELDGQSLPRAVSDIPWGHNITLFQKLKDPARRLWYAKMTIEHGWSRPVLVHQIESGLFKRQGKAISNFKQTLPPAQSDLAQQAMKDPYTFDFLNIASDAHERELEQGLLDHIQRFLMELGVGFAFVGRQVHMDVGDQDFYIDLLLYHLRLRCFVVIELLCGAPHKRSSVASPIMWRSVTMDELY